MPAGVCRLAGGLCVAAILALTASGCRRGEAESPFAPHRTVADRVSQAMEELQKRRNALQGGSDIGEVIAGLRVNQQPPEPEPDPVVVAPEPVAESPGDVPAGPVAPVEVRLQGVAWHDREPLAIINRKTVGVGDRVDGYRVDQIRKNGVLLTAPDGTTRELRLYEPAANH